MTTPESLSLGSSLATALATAALFYVTYILAKETKNLAEATERPLVTVNIVLSSQANGFLNLEILNTGNAPAFDVLIQISPNLTSQGENFEPFKSVPLINPASKLTVFLIDSLSWVGNKYDINVSWAKRPESKVRDELKYSIDLSIYSNIPFNAMIDPMFKIANEIENLRRDAKSDAMAQRRFAKMPKIAVPPEGVQLPPDGTEGEESK